ncbi:aminopeptidase [Arenibacterium halophilum]|uniref:Leucyl aminopeptidase n=1 Tax=Arenibacterium halophilum TaxID=2583821 RepID=A0ABY2WX97_9RHOB|nr:aminopeptidase [Arenibacterium halophilum]TMV07454.1 leucyl aminopeptidase [Arenibacterium halophilum]
MKDLLLMKGARRLVTVCGNLKAGEEVVIVTDFATMDVAEAVAKAALEISDNVNVLVMPVRTIDGQEPPAPIAAAMKKADLIFTPVKHSITHTFAVRDALGEGARAIMLTQYNTTMLERGGVFGDFAGIEPLCRKVGELLGAADKVRLTTPNGTDLTLSVKDRPSNPHCGIVRQPGDFTTVPNIETSSSPVLGSAEGVIVADASVPYYGIGVLEEPIRFTVKNGRVSKIEGGRQARELDKLLAKQGAPEVYNIAQISFGLNPDCPMEGVMLHDEGVYGTSHIGIGTSVLLGGEVKTLTHFDALMWQPTLELDGKVVLRDGDWLLPEASVIDGTRAAA